MVSQTIISHDPSNLIMEHETAVSCVHGRHGNRLRISSVFYLAHHEAPHSSTTLSKLVESESIVIEVSSPTTHTRHRRFSLQTLMVVFNNTTLLLAQQAQFAAVYDWFLTIDSEWNIGTLLYAFTRYPAFADTAISLYSVAAHSIPIPVCHLLLNVFPWMFLFGVVISEVVMIVCVWAMWGRKRWMAISLTVLAVVVAVVAVAWLNQHHSASIYISPEDMPPSVPGCHTKPGGSTTFVDFVALTFLESVFFFLMLSKAIEHSRGHASTFVVECFRYGLLYYMVLTASSITNLVVILRATHEYENLLTSLQRTFHAILRSAYQPRSENSVSTVIGGSVVFRGASGTSMDDVSDGGRISVI
ncbi:hypothetical protein BD779DRAFT_1532698 [Infundibulicybe gibba]|nr:hypothetical protein BD779DRAFT_1532698 [Infundibulicybe gibba]